MFSIHETPWDLRFSLFRIPVRVHPGFWLVGLLMGWANGRLDLTATWLGVLFVSILVHELGHALAARSFGWPPNILLYHFGGLAMFTPGWGYTKWRSIWISFAGPLAGFLLYGVVLLVESVVLSAFRGGQAWAERLLLGMDDSRTPFDFALGALKYVNLWWGFVNLLPVWPLDGGRICEQLCHADRSHAGRRMTHQIGMVTGGLVAAYFFGAGDLFPALLFGGLAWDNYRRMQPGGWS